MEKLRGPGSGSGTNSPGTVDDVPGVTGVGGLEEGSEEGSDRGEKTQSSAGVFLRPQRTPELKLCSHDLVSEFGGAYLKFSIFVCSTQGASPQSDVNI